MEREKVWQWLSLSYLKNRDINDKQEKKKKRMGEVWTKNLITDIELKIFSKYTKSSYNSTTKIQLLKSAQKTEIEHFSKEDI